MDGNGQACSDDARRLASAMQGTGQASGSGTWPVVVDATGRDLSCKPTTPTPATKQAQPTMPAEESSEPWLFAALPSSGNSSPFTTDDEGSSDYSHAEAATRAGSTVRCGPRSACAATNNSTLPVCAMPQHTPARECLSDFPDEILSHIFSRVDAATLLGAVPHVCRGWRAACANDDHGPKVRLELDSMRQVLRIRAECLGLWVAATVRRFAWVVDLDLSICGIEDGVLEGAGSLPRIASLNLNGCDKMTDPGLLQHVAILTQLTKLHLGSCRKITDTGLKHVAQLTQLTRLDLSGDEDFPSKITDTGLEHIAQLTQLTSLNLRSCDKITDTGLEHVAELTQLTSLDLEACNETTDMGLAHVAQLTQLTSLVLGGPGCKITDTGLEHVAQLTQLTSLDVDYCDKITDTGLQHVAQLTLLTSLNLEACYEITDTGLEHVAQLTQLTSLNLGSCRKITDTGLEHVAQLTQLTSLNLHSCANITDNGITDNGLQNVLH